MRIEDRNKIERYIDKCIDDLKKTISTYEDNGLSGSDLIEKTIDITIKRIPKESKTILSSEYDILKNETLQDSLFADENNELAFYEMNILKNLNSMFDFKVPENIENINYQESYNKINEWIVGGGIIVVGGVISIPLKSAIPVCVAAVLAAIMVILLKSKKNEVNSNVNDIINEYLDDVKKSLMMWVDSISDYYDTCIEQLKENLTETSKI